MSIVPIHPDDLEAAESDPMERADGNGVARRTAARRTLGKRGPGSRRTLGKRIPPSRRTLGRRVAPSRRTLMPRIKL